MEWRIGPDNNRSISTVVRMFGTTLEINCVNLKLSQSPTVSSVPRRIGCGLHRADGTYLMQLQGKVSNRVLQA